MKLRLLLTMLFTSAAAMAADGGYLFVTFKGEATPMTEQVYFGLSKDGREWEALNGAEPVLVSKRGEKGVRDPYILRSHDGKKTFLIATDLSIHLNRNWTRATQDGSKSIMVWESDDLVTWSTPRLERVAPNDAGCTWAPEAIYDEENQDYLVFWASKTRRDDFAKHRIWACRTKDFKTFGEPFIYIDNPQDVIDTTIVREKGRYYRFSKDEKFKAITMEVSDKLMGPWQNVDGFTLDTLTGYEGPTCYILEPATAEKPATWCLMLDHYAKGEGYKPFLCDDLSTGQFTPAPDIQLPFRFRHGSVLPVNAEEYARLKKAYGKR